MVIVDHSCDLCKHMRRLINRCIITCDAYPNGVPSEYIRDVDPRSLMECAPGYKWEPKEKDEN